MPCIRLAILESAQPILPHHRPGCECPDGWQERLEERKKDVQNGTGLFGLAQTSAHTI